LTSVVEEPQKEPQEKKPGKSQRKTVVVVGLVCIGVVAAVVAMNLDRLAAHSDGSGPTGQETESPSALNTAPVILSVTPATDRIEPLDVLQVICKAEDDDGDALTYTWMAEQGDVSGEGATVEWGAPSTEGLFRLSVEVDDGSGGTAEYSTSLRVKRNYAPEFVSAPVFTEGVLPGGSTLISCSAQDADGDAVTYEWEASIGEVFGEGNSIVWVAPDQPGSYLVTVFARDAYGGESKRDVIMNVTPAASPRLGSFVVKAIDHDMLQFEAGVWEIFQGRSCSVQCIVVEGDEPFTYTWTVDQGELTADGATARWDAPEERGPATITVDVTDVNGNTTTGILLMYVETCTCAFD
jgi:hypothetical protein